MKRKDDAVDDTRDREYVTDEFTYWSAQMHQDEHWTCTCIVHISFCIFASICKIYGSILLSLVAFFFFNIAIIILFCVSVCRCTLFLGRQNCFVCLRLGVCVRHMYTNTHIHSLYCNNDAYKIGKHTHTHMEMSTRVRCTHTHAHTSFRRNLFLYFLFDGVVFTCWRRGVWRSVCECSLIL